MNSSSNSTRAPFTEDDDNQLCRHLALRIPVKEAGGRTGDNVYKELEKLVRPPDNYDFADIYDLRRPHLSHQNTAG